MNEILIDGYCHPKFLSVYQVFKENFELNLELGASFSVYKEGKPLIDIHAGYTDINKTIKWNKNTIVNVHSTGKGLVAICISILIENGLLDLDKKIKYYWPEFANNNKEDIKVRELLSHQAGLYGWRKKIFTQDLYDWNYCTKLLAEQQPFHNPREETCYHAKTIGYLSGELIRRISGKSVGQFLQDELIRGEDMLAFIGTPEKYHSLISSVKRIEEIKPNLKKKDKYINIAFNNPPSNNKVYETKEWKTNEIPALNCYSNSSSLARIYDFFINDTDKRKALINRTTMHKVTKIESDKMDYIMRLPIKWSPVGFIIDGGELFGLNKSSFGHTGSGGSMAFADPEKRIGVSYTMNSFSSSLVGDNRARNLVKALYKCI